MKQLIGTGVALITPFNEDFSIDVKGLKNVVNYTIKNGVDYLVVLGTTAESVTLSKEEKTQVIDIIVETNKGRLPLVLGIGGNNTAAVVNEIKTTNLDDFTAILSVSPYYNKPSQEGIFQHFSAIAASTSKPIILYNVPSRTASNIQPETVFRLVKRYKNIVGIKEAAGDIVQAMKLINGTSAEFLVISGDDMLALPMVLAGGLGVISVIGGGYPKEFSKMIRLGLNHKNSEAYSIHYNLVNIIDYIFEEGNPAGIKALYTKKGLCGNLVRLPLVAVSDQLQHKIDLFVDEFCSD